MNRIRYKGQVSIELIFFVVVSLIILSMFSIYFARNVTYYKDYKKEKDAKELLEKIKWNLNYAYMAGNGFHHFIDLPAEINNKIYTVNFTNYGFFIIVDGKAYYSDLMFQSINGTLQPGEKNEIINKGGMLYVKRSST